MKALGAANRLIREMTNTIHTRLLILLAASLTISATAHASLIVGDLFSGPVTSFGDGTSNCSALSTSL